MYDKIVKQALLAANDKGVFIEGDYYAPCFGDDDTLEVLYCGTCNHRKEFYPYYPSKPYPENEIAPKAERNYFKDENGNPWKVAVACECERNRMKEKERRGNLNRLVAERKLNCWGYLNEYGVMERNRAMEDFIFQKYEANKHINKAIGYVNSFSERQKEGKGIMFIGKSGAGKTISGMCLANELMNRGIEVFFKQQFEITRLSQYEDKSIFEQLERCKVLIVDDFNPEDLNDYGATILFNLYELRLKRKLITCFTSNIKKTALENPQKPKDKLLFDRIIANTYIVEDSSHNYRKEMDNDFE